VVSLPHQKLLHGKAACLAETLPTHSIIGKLQPMFNFPVRISHQILSWIIHNTSFMQVNTLNFVLILLSVNKIASRLDVELQQLLFANLYS
jgi:hypothetical protein